MRVVLKTDHSESSRGFKARWSTEDPVGKMIVLMKSGIVFKET